MSVRLVLTERPSPELRCAFCHDDLDADTFECPQCQTKLHADCADNIPECPTLGCRRSLIGLRAPGDRRPRPTRAAFRQALLNLARSRPKSAAALSPPPRLAPREGGWVSEEEGVTGPTVGNSPPLYLLLIVCFALAVVTVLTAIVASASGSTANALLGLGALAVVALVGAVGAFHWVRRWMI